MKREREVTMLAYHRNGISGAGFYVGIVREPISPKGRKARDMLVIRFPGIDRQVGNVVCAAFDLELLAQGIIEFGENSWRGDHYHEVMDEAIRAKGEIET